MWPMSVRIGINLLCFSYLYIGTAIVGDIMLHTVNKTSNAWPLYNLHISNVMKQLKEKTKQTKACGRFRF